MLKGLGGVCLGLPWLEAMQPSLGKRVLAAGSQPAAPKRFVAITANLGFHVPYLFPESPGKLTPTTPYLSKLADHLDQLTAISGLSHPEQQGDNGHASEMTFLTSAQRPGLAGFRNTISIDQRIAAEIGIQTRFPFLALSTRGGTSASWTASGVAIPGESSAEKLFAALFLDGSQSEVEQELQRIRRGRSILDTLAARAGALDQQLGQRDRVKLEEYLASVRELELRLQQSEGWVRRPKPSMDTPPPKDAHDQNAAIARQKLLLDIIAKALQTDSTRIITLSLAGLNAVPDIPGVQSDWHGLSHHGKDPAKIEELRIIEETEFGVFNDFLTQIRGNQEGDGNLLEHTAVLYASNLGNASAPRLA